MIQNHILSKYDINIHIKYKKKLINYLCCWKTICINLKLSNHISKNQFLKPISQIYIVDNIYKYNNYIQVQNK